MRCVFVRVAGAGLWLAILAGSAGARVAAAEPAPGEFAPAVSVAISDDAAGSHPDIAITIDIASGPLVGSVRTLTAAGGGIAASADLPDGIIVGWISGYSTIVAGDGTCSARFMFEAPLVSASAATADFPPFLQQLAPGVHRLRMVADVGGTPVNMVVDEVEVAGVPRLQTTTYIGDPGQPPPPNCAPFRSRVILGGMAAADLPLTTAPPTPGPRIYEFALTSRADAPGRQQTVERRETAAVVPFAPVITGGELRWDRYPGAASYALSGLLTYSTNCEMIRRLVIHEEYVDVSRMLGPEVTALPLPGASDPAYELRQGFVTVSPRDGDGVLLARATTPSISVEPCRYAPGEEPAMTVAPDSGSCTGNVTFTGARFPPGVTVSIELARYGTDAGGPEVARTRVAGDGTFVVGASLQSWACPLAAAYPGNRFPFFAYNADAPHGLSIFARAEYTATDAARPPVTLPAAGAPGDDPDPAARHIGTLLLVVGLLNVLAGRAVRRDAGR